MHKPLNSHLKLAFRILKYLKKTPGKGLWYEPGSGELFAYVDSDYGKCLTTRNSLQFLDLQQKLNLEL